jgi:hypothetical protein
MSFAYRLSVFLLLPSALLLSSCSAPSSGPASKTAGSVIPPIVPATTPAVLTFSVTGPMETVFQHSTQACEDLDIPDDAARAFRDSTGNVHLIASHYINRAMIGPDLNDVVNDCDIIYEDNASADPMTFDDLGWLETYYTVDGVTINGLVSLDYHPNRHNLPCGTSSATAADCWYGTIIQATSTNGGYSFTSPPEGEQRFVAGSEYVYDPYYTNRQGAFVPSNIISWNGYYYMELSVSGQGPQPSGECVLRTSNLSDPAAWRAWDGTGYNTQFVDPAAYQDGVDVAPVNPAQHVCAVVGGGNLTSELRNLLVLPNGQGFLGVMYRIVTNTDGSINYNVYGTTSVDLINWTPGVLITSLPELNGTAYSYPSLIDPSSTSRNFETITQNSGYLYFTFFHPDTNLDRDLVRFPVTISGLQ